MKTCFQILLLIGLLLLAPVVQAQWTTASLSYHRFDMAATSAGGKVFFAGGVSNGSFLNKVDICDVASNTWTTATLSEARSSLAATSAGSKVFFAGGFNSSSVFSNRVDIYDTATHAWTTATLSQARANLCAVSAGGKVFFAGGGRQAPSPCSEVVDIYDLATDTWSTASLWQARDRIGATAVGNKVFFAGGYDCSGGSANVIDVYDLTTNVWSHIPLAQGRFAMGAASAGGKALFGGGVSWSVESKSVNIYHSSTDTWSTANLSQARANVAAASAGNLIFFGGGSINISPSAVVDIYNATTNTWSSSSLSQGRSGIAVASAGGKVYFAGGRNGNDFEGTTLVDIYTVGQATVITQQPTPGILNVCVGGAISSSLTATGAGMLTYQWFKKGSPDVALPTQTTSTLTLTNLQPADAGTYYCQVAGDAETTQSADVTVTSTSPAFSAAPTVNPTPVCAGASISVTFATNCFPDGTSFTAQLSDGNGSFANAVGLGTVIPGSNPVTIPAVTPAGTGYLVRVISSTGLVSASSPALTVNAPVLEIPVVAQVPVCVGGQITANFTASCFPAGTTFTAQLSDGNGGFANPTNLGAVTPGANSPSIPGNLVAGAGYRIRIVSSTSQTTTGSLPFTIVAPAFTTAPNVNTTSVCAGTPLVIDFESGPCGFPAGNVFTAQLSDANGDFANAVSLGAVTSGSNSVNIPAGTPTGIGYKIRIVSSNPGLQSASSGAFSVAASGFIGKPIITGTPVCAGKTVQLNFMVGCFPAGTTFSADLSDTNGNFQFAVKLGPVLPGTNQLVIPFGMGGTGYQIRVRSNSGDKSSPSESFEIRELKITAPTVNGTPICAGQNVVISFSVEFECPLGKSNVFTAELSNAGGQFSAPVVLGQGNPGNNTYQIPFGTPAGTLYRVRIVASDPALISPESAAFEIKTAGFNGVPTLELVPVCAGKGMLITFGLTCPFPVGTSLTAELSDKNGSFAASVALGLVNPGATNVTIPAFSPAGTGYRIRIKSSTGAVSPQSANFQVNAIDFGGAPTVSGIPVCVGKNSSITFLIPGCPFPADNVFKAELSDASGNFGVVTSLGVVVAGAANSVTFPANLPTGAGYKVRIVASKPALISSPSLAFSILQPGFGPLVTVSGVPVCKGSKVALNFTTLAPCSFGANNTFKAELSDANGSFASPVSLGVVAPNGFNITIPSNTPTGTGYRIRVLSNSPTLVSPTSAPFSINICKGSREAAADEIGLNVIAGPNPSLDGRLTIRITGVKDQLLHVDLFNVSGVPIRQQLIESASDEDTLYWDIARQPVGLYLLRVNAGFQTKTVKILH